ncbi:DUF1986 domain-containing protein [Micromonospora sp. C31]|nr:DUF1986 domain-containing protein [Micromonospora sp. C31]
MSRKLAVLVAALMGAVGGPAVVTPAHAIYGGVTAGHLREAAQVYVDGQYRCTAVVLNSSWLLTAEHCTEGITAARFHVYAGDRRRGHGYGKVVQRVEEFGRADLALIKVWSPFPSSVATTTLPPINQPIPAPGVLMSASGWGNWAQTGYQLPDSLQVCSVKLLGTYDDDGVTHIMGEPTGGAFTRSGDSGGPLTQGGYTWGILSGTVEGQPNRSVWVSLTDTVTRMWILLELAQP